jgi:dTMP kinase
LPLIALEGIDKAGKNTQSRWLQNKLTAKGCAVNHVAFPDYSTSLGGEIQKFLQGEIQLRPEVRQLLYVANRWERQSDLLRWLNDDSFVIADRYVPSGLAYGLANELSLDWMINLEKGLPPADVVVIIDIPVEESYRRAVKKDIYEMDINFLTKVRNAYLELASEFNWVIVNGEQSIDAVSNDIWKKVKTRIGLSKKNC